MYQVPGEAAKLPAWYMVPGTWYGFGVRSYVYAFNTMKITTPVMETYNQMG
jgi:hypothetical protein